MGRGRREERVERPPRPPGAQAAGKWTKMDILKQKCYFTSSKTFKIFSQNKLKFNK
jgi:hypothetical protein